MFRNLRRPGFACIEVLTSARRRLHGGEEVEKEACFIVGLMAIRPEHQHEIADKGALRGLVSLLKRHVPGTVGG